MDIAMFDRISTNIVAIPIPKPLAADVDTPKVGHIPKSITKIGFSLIIPRVRLERLFLLMAVSRTEISERIKSPVQRF